MSADYEVYVGPYVECKVTKIQNAIAIAGCVTEGCPRFHVRIIGECQPYCPSCGNQINHFPMVVSNDSVDTSDLLENDGFCNIFVMPMGDTIERVMDTRNIHVYIPNEIKAPGSTFDPRGEFDIRELKPKSMVYEPARWKAQIEDTPAYGTLVAAYGIENIVFKWGVINWVN